jgi:hypothetical protein
LNRLKVPNTRNPHVEPRLRSTVEPSELEEVEEAVVDAQLDAFDSSSSSPSPS